VRKTERKQIKSKLTTIKTQLYKIMTQLSTCFDILEVNNTICNTVGNDAIYRYATIKQISVK